MTRSAHFKGPDINAFIKQVNDLPSGPASLDAALAPCLAAEAELRQVFATDKAHPMLKDPYVGLVDVFSAPDTIRQSRPRVVKDEVDLSKRYVLPVPEEKRRKEGELAMAPSIEEFKDHFKIFSGV
jgi:hypothetical protein